MSEENLVKPHRELVALDEPVISKINKWFEQIDAKKKIKISRKTLVNWLLGQIPDLLTNSELNALIETFYDERKFLRQLLRQSQEAKANGVADTLEVIVRPKKVEAKKEPEAIEEH